MSEEWFALDQLETTFFIAGVYEIENLVNGRVYVGESANIHARIINHLGSLRGGRHDNVAMQEDWDRLMPSDFRMRVVREMPGSSKRDRLDAESEEEDRQRDAGYTLYVDIGAKEEDTEEPVKEPEPEIDGIPFSEYIELLKRPSLKKEAEYMDCVDCERRGTKFITCDDDKIRCEDCAEERSKQMTQWILSRPTQERKMSETVWRWQLDGGSFENQVVMCMTRYIKKFDARPQVVQAHRKNLDGENKEIAGAEIRIGSWTPEGYIDLPLPEDHDRHETGAHSD